MPSYEFNSKKVQAAKQRAAQRRAAEYADRVAKRQARPPSLTLLSRMHKTKQLLLLLFPGLDEAQHLAFYAALDALDMALASRTHLDAAKHLRGIGRYLPALFHLIEPRG